MQNQSIKNYTNSEYITNVPISHAVFMNATYYNELD